MKRIYTTIVCLLAAVLLLAAPQEMLAKKKSGKGKKSKTEAEAPVKKKTPYEKFISKKGTKTFDGFVKIYTSGDDVWFEIPDSLIGRKLIQSSILEKSASLEMASGMEVSENSIFQIAKTDSLILFQTPAPKFCIEGEESGIRNALESSQSQQTLFAFPIKYRNADSTASVVKVSNIFDMSKKSVASFAGLDYGNLKIEKNTYKKEFSRTIGIDCFGNTIGVRKEATFELSLYIPGFGFRSSQTPTLTAQVISSVTLMPEKEVAQREVDDRIGVRKITAQVYKSSGGIETKKIASRWDFTDGDGVTIYVDTLLGESWMAAVKKGIEAWNPALEKAGYKNAVKVLPYPAGDSSFRVDNPLVSLVTYAGGSGMSLSADMLTDTSTGEIMSVRILVPGDFVNGVRRAGVYAISDVDPRYQEYYICDEAVCEVLAAKTMSIFGRCLGLEKNLAGSHAFSPSQLSDPAFTQANGITGSVTDDVLFNVFAKPGDKEKGLVTIVDRVGPYDEYAIEWLYGHEDSPEALDELIRSRAGDPAYFYAGAVKGRVSDPRLAKEALGNDPFAEYEASISHLKYVAANAAKWLEDDSIPQVYKDLFIDWVWLGVNTAAFRLTPYIGGMYANNVTEGKPKFEPVAEDIQKKCLQLVFEAYSNLKWMEEGPAKDLIQLPGANKDVSRFTNMNLFSMADVYMRLFHVAMSNEEAGSTYTVEEYLNDVEKLIFKDLLKGNIVPGGEIIVSNYLAMFLQISPVMKQNYKDNTVGYSNSIAASEDFRVAINGVPVEYAVALENYAWIYMQRASRLLKQARTACRNDYDRKKLDYMINLADSALGKN